MSAGRVASVALRLIVGCLGKPLYVPKGKQHEDLVVLLNDGFVLSCDSLQQSFDLVH